MPEQGAVTGRLRRNLSRPRLTGGEVLVLAACIALAAALYLIEIRPSITEAQEGGLCADVPRGERRACLADARRDLGIEPGAAPPTSDAPGSLTERLAGLDARTTLVERRLRETLGMDGTAGRRGRDGRSGVVRLQPITVIRRGPRGPRGRRGAKGEKGDRGDRGAPGVSPPAPTVTCTTTPTPVEAMLLGQAVALTLPFPSCTVG